MAFRAWGFQIAISRILESSLLMFASNTGIFHFFLTLYQKKYSSDSGVRRRGDTPIGLRDGAHTGRAENAQSRWTQSRRHRSVGGQRGVLMRTTGFHEKGWQQGCKRLDTSIHAWRDNVYVGGREKSMLSHTLEEIHYLIMRV